MPEWINLDAVELWDKNPNEGDVPAIMSSIRTFGYSDTIHLWQDNITKGGNHRVKALRQLLNANWLPSGECIRVVDDDVQIRYTDISAMSEIESDAFGVVINRTTRLGEDDSDKLAALLNDLDDDLIDALSFSPEELAEIQGESDAIQMLLSEIEGGSSGYAIPKRVAVKFVVEVEDASTIEQAIQSTGFANRGQAVKYICESFINAEAG
jgi:hypothetical protein